jgi:hypothetical protein
VAREDMRFITQLLNDADTKTQEAEDLRACANECEADAASLRKRATDYQAGMSKARLKALRKVNGAGMVEQRGKAKDTLKTRPARKADKRGQRGSDQTIDPNLGAPAAPPNQETTNLLPSGSHARRHSGIAYSQAYTLQPSEEPLMSGGVLTTIDHPNFDCAQLRLVETHVYETSEGRDAAVARRRQFITEEEDKIDGMLTWDDDVDTSNEPVKELAFSEEPGDDRGDPIEIDLTGPTRDDEPSQCWFYDTVGDDLHYTSQIGMSQRRLLDDLL